ncbi:hypothetical protein KC727_02905 [Candidatus Kaiserbacteria bacterium]|nr:hypothetical protein [Candidatus Kaiserbacteria bacterium]
MVSNIAAVPVTDTAYGYIATSGESVTEQHIAGLDTEDAVRAYFKDIPVMIQIARCESHFRHILSDGSVLRGKVDSADVGVMQINTRYHGQTASDLGLNLLNLYDNMSYARDLYERQGTKPWSASAPCWERTLAMK